jgi:YceI-like domain
VRTRFEDSTALLTALASEVSTGNRMLDRVLAGPSFLDTDSYPAISLRSRSLVRVPTGWRSVGQLEVKGVPRPIACELEPDLRAQQPGPAIALKTCWLLESTWITPKRVPMLGRRVAMTCSVVLNRAPETTARSAAPAA